MCWDGSACVNNDCVPIGKNLTKMYCSNQKYEISLCMYM